MSHVWIPIFLVVLLVGIWALVSLYHVSKVKKHPIVPYMVTIVVGCNLLVLVDLIVTYICLNVVENCEDISSTPFHFISFAIAMLGLVGIVWALVSADRLLTAGSLTRAWQRGVRSRRR